MTATERDAGFDDWLDAIRDGDGYYLECENDHGSLPPRRVCPDCGSSTLTEEPLSEVGTVETYTVVHVGTPSFEDDAPYATAVVSFDGVRVTGQLRGVDFDELEVGMAVEATVEETATTGDDLLVFRQR